MLYFDEREGRPRTGVAGSLRGRARRWDLRQFDAYDAEGGSVKTGQALKRQELLRRPYKINLLRSESFASSSTCSFT